MKMRLRAQGGRLQGLGSDPARCPPGALTQAQTPSHCDFHTSDSRGWLGRRLPGGFQGRETCVLRLGLAPPRRRLTISTFSRVRVLIFSSILWMLCSRSSFFLFILLFFSTRGFSCTSVSRERFSCVRRRQRPRSWKTQCMADITPPQRTPETPSGPSPEPELPASGPQSRSSMNTWKGPPPRGFQTQGPS